MKFHAYRTRARASYSQRPRLNAIHRAILGVMIAMAGAGAAHADLVQYTITTPAGVQRTLPPTQQYANATGTMNFMLSGGLSRSVRISIRSADGKALVSTASSKVLGAGDIVTANGATYYGTTLSLQAPAAGSYQLVADVLDSTGNLVSSNTYALTIDVKPPAITGWQAEGWGMVRSWSGEGTGVITQGLPDNAMVGPSEAQLLSLYGLTDSSGIASATFESVSSDGSAIYHSETATIDNAKGTVSIGNETSGSITTSKDFPALDTPLIARFIVTDNAGNTATFDKPLRWNGVGLVPSSWSIVGVSNPNTTTNLIAGSPFSGYDPYVPGMTVNQNPFKLIIRIDKSQWIAYNPYGIRFYQPGGDTSDWEDSQYIYKVIPLSYNSAGNSGEQAWFNDATSYSLATIPYNLKLSATAPVAPSFASPALQIQYQDIGLSSTIYRLTNVPISWTAVTLNANPQPYAQVAKSWVGSCTIPAGQTHCTVTASGTLSPGSGGTNNIESLASLRSADGTLVSSVDPDVRLIVDATGVAINSGSVNLPAHTATFTGTKNGIGNYWGLLTVGKASIEAKSAAVDKTFAGVITFTGATSFSVTSSFAGLPDGQYDLIANASDTAGSTATLDLGTFTMDTTPPVITSSISNGASIASIDDVLVGVTDNVDPAPKLTSANLQGGLSAVNVNLAFSQDSAGKYHLQYPALAPTLNSATGQNQPYVLTLKASDASGNVSTLKVSFSYMPPQVTAVGLNNGVARMPAVPQVITTIKSPPLVLNKGTVVSGQFPVTATLLSSSTIPLAVNGITIQPGATATVADSYDFTRSAGVLSMPVNPVTADRAGKAYLVLQTIAPNSPVVVAEIDTWSPSQQLSLSVAGKATSFTVDVAPVSMIGTSSGPATDCTGGVTYATPATITARGSLLGAGAYQCAIQVDADSGTLVDYTMTSQGVVAYLHAVGANQAVYEPGVIYRDPVSSKVSFFSTVAKSLALTGTSLDDAAPVWAFQSAKSGDASQSTGSGASSSLATPGTNQYAGQMRATAPNPNLVIVTTDPSRKTTTTASQSNTVASPIYTSDSTLWDELRYGFDVHYARRPDKVWHQDLDLSVQPSAVTIVLNRQTGTLISTTSASISGQVGIQQAGALHYDPTGMGDWRVQAFVKVVTRNANGIITNTALQPLEAAPMTVNSDGTFTLPVGDLPSGPADVVVQATLFHNGAATTRVVTAGDLQLTVQNGAALDASLKVATATSGVITPTAAFVPALNVLVDSRQQQNISVVHWFVSTDGGTTWSSAGDTTMLGLRPQITTPGTYLYKARLVNRYSQATSDTNTVTVEGFDRPTLSIQGPTAGYAGTPVTFTGVSNLSDTSFTWSVRNGYTDTKPQTFTGASITLTPTAAGTLYITLSGQEATGTIANPVRTRTVSGLYTVASLALPKPVIAGSRTLETGKPATFTVTQNSPFVQSAQVNQKLDGQWVLPDGTTQPGFGPLTFTVQPGQTQVQFQSWVDGLQSASLTSSAYTFSTWTYAFPKMTLAMSLPVTQAPAPGVFTANYANPADARNTGGEKFTYNWSLPAGASVTSQQGSTIGVQFTQPGAQQVTVTVNDTRGNSQTLTQAMTILPAAELQATLALDGSDKWSRAPSNVQAVLRITSMPKGDALANIVYALDGTPILTSTNAAVLAVLPVPTAGDHTISATITTKAGAKTTVAQSFSLVTGSNPVCAISQSGSAQNVVLRETCTVDMGSIAGVKWSLNGQPTSLSSSYITITGASLATLQNASVTATTDKGQTGSATWNRQ